MIHLLAGPRVLGLGQTLGVLFVLNGLGFLGGIAVYVSRYWRRELYLVEAGYAAVTTLALFAFQGFSLDVFRTRNGSLNPMAVDAKAAEAVLVVRSISLYANTEP